METTKMVIIHALNMDVTLGSLRSYCKAPLLHQNGSYTTVEGDFDDGKYFQRYGLGLDYIPYNTVLFKNGKTEQVNINPCSFSVFPMAYHILLEGGNNEIFDNFESVFTLNQLNRLKQIIKIYKNSGFEITGAYEHNPGSHSPGFLIAQLMKTLGYE